MFDEKKKVLEVSPSDMDYIVEARADALYEILMEESRRPSETAREKHQSKLMAMKTYADLYPPERAAQVKAKAIEMFRDFHKLTYKKNKNLK